MKKTLLVGAGPMAVEYAKALSGMNENYLVVGRSRESAEKFRESTGKEALLGGVESCDAKFMTGFDSAIVSVPVESLFGTTCALLNMGVKRILVEKPGGINKAELESISALAKNKAADVFIAYNRRFYASTIEAAKIIEEDGGVLSFSFDFTEWSHIVEKIPMPASVSQNYIMANSSHLIDLAFYLCGKPKEMVSFHSGGLEWHSSASVFAGAGISSRNALFSYQANWDSAGRFGLELMTSKRKLIFRPIEKLVVQEKGSVELKAYPVDYSRDEAYKPGIYLQVESFLTGNDISLCSIAEQIDNYQSIRKIGNYA